MVTECHAEVDGSGDVPDPLSSAEFCQQAVVPVLPGTNLHSPEREDMLKALTKFQARMATRDKGATAVEYGLLVALIAAVIVGVVGILGGQVTAAFQTVVDALP